MLARLKNINLIFLKSSELNAILIKDIVASAFLVLSIFFPYMKWVLVAILIVYMLLELNINSFVHVLFFSSGLIDVYCISILVFAFVFIQIVLLVIDIINKRKNIVKSDYIFFLCSLAIIVYICVFANNRIYFLGKSMTFLCLLFLIFKSKNDIDLEKFIKIYIYGILILYILSLFALLKLDEPIFYNDVLRYQAFSTNPNIFYKFTLTALASSIYLYFKKNISKLQVVLIYVILNCLTIITMSKAALIILLFIDLFFIICLAYFNKKDMLLFFLAFVCVIIISLPYINLIFDRFDNSLIEVGSGIEIKNDKLNSITTGRYDLLVFYFNRIIQSPGTFIFGYGYGNYDSSVNFGPHNTFIQIWYQTGLVGLFMVIVFGLLYIFFQKKHKYEIYKIGLIFVILMIMCNEDIFFIPYSIFWLILIALCFWKEEEKNT